MIKARICQNGTHKSKPVILIVVYRDPNPSHLTGWIYSCDLHGNHKYLTRTSPGFAHWLTEPEMEDPPSIVRRTAAWLVDHVTRSLDCDPVAGAAYQADCLPG